MSVSAGGAVEKPALRGRTFIGARCAEDCGASSRRTHQGTSIATPSSSRDGPLPNSPRSTTALAAALTVTVGAAAVGWLVVVLQMSGMSMGVATTSGLSTAFGPFPNFVGLWVAMAAATMLPGAAPAVLKRARSAAIPACAATLFACSYLAVWTLAGIAIYWLFPPREAVVDGLVVFAAGVYELTPVKAAFRRRCREGVTSGLAFGRDCVGSCLGLMLVQIAFGVMSLPWMLAVSAVILAQKLLPSKAVVDLPVAVAILGLSAFLTFVPAPAIGFTPTMCGIHANLVSR